MKSIFLVLALIPLLAIGQGKTDLEKNLLNDSYIKSTSSITLEGALKLSEFALQLASELDKNVSIAVLDSNGSILLLLKGNEVGVHNTEASRRKAYTALSTKTPSFELMQKAANDPTANNFNTLPELLLLGGGVPIWNQNEIVGSIGISGAGGGFNDHNLAKLAIEKLGFSTSKE